MADDWAVRDGKPSCESSPMTAIRTELVRHQRYNGETNGIRVFVKPTAQQVALVGLIGLNRRFDRKMTMIVRS